MVIKLHLILLFCKLFRFKTFNLQYLLLFFFLYVRPFEQVVIDCPTFVALLFYKEKALWKGKETDYITQPMSMMRAVWVWL